MVTRKISRHVASWMHRGSEPLRLGRIDVCRDWGFAGDYVEAMHLMLQQETPTDYVIGTGKARSVEELLHQTLEAASIPYESVAHLISHDAAFDRENEIDSLCADASRAKRELGWQPRTSFSQLVKMMLDADFAALSASAERATAKRMSA